MSISLSLNHVIPNPTNNYHPARFAAAGLDVVTWVFLAAVAEATRPPGLIETKVVYKDPAGYAPGPN